MATLTGSSLFTFPDLCGVTANKQKLPIVCRRIKPFLSLDHSGQEFRRTLFSFKLFSNDHRSFRISQWSTLQEGGTGDVIQVDRPKDGLMNVVLLILLWLSFLFTDITDVNWNKGSTRGGRLIKGQDNWLHVRFAPSAVRRNHLQRSGFF